MFNCPRTATIKADNYCTFAKISADSFNKYTHNLTKELKLKSIKYKDRLKQFKIKLLKEIDYFELEEIDNNPMFYEEL